MPRQLHPNRAAAIAAGANTFEGKPCAHGHTLRHVKSAGCVECQRQGQRRRRGTPEPAELPDLDALLGG